MSYPKNLTEVKLKKGRAIMYICGQEVFGITGYKITEFWDAIQKEQVFRKILEYVSNKSGNPTDAIKEDVSYFKQKRVGTKVLQPIQGPIIAQTMKAARLFTNVAMFLADISSINKQEDDTTSLLQSIEKTLRTSTSEQLALAFKDYDLKTNSLAINSYNNVLSIKKASDFSSVFGVVTFHVCRYILNMENAALPVKDDNHPFYAHRELLEALVSTSTIVSKTEEGFKYDIMSEEKSNGNTVAEYMGNIKIEGIDPVDSDDEYAGYEEVTQDVIDEEEEEEEAKHPIKGLKTLPLGLSNIKRSSLLLPTRSLLVQTSSFCIKYKSLADLHKK